MRQGGLRWLSAAGFRSLRWWEWGPGDGAPVLCVHGLTRSGRDFDALAGALADQGRRVLCPDLPGRGSSDWLPDPAMYAVPTYVTALGHLLARLDGPVDWVGTSLGGLCSMAVAATPGQPIRRMVLNDIGPFVPKAALARIRDYLGTAPATFPDAAALEAHLRRVHAPFGPLTDAQWRHLAETSARPVDGRVALHYDPALVVPIRAAEPADLDLWPIWDRIVVPTLALRGESSDLLLPDTAERMGAKAGVRVATISGCGHAPALMDAEQIALVARFLAE